MCGSAQPDFIRLSHSGDNTADVGSAQPAFIRYSHSGGSTANAGSAQSAFIRRSYFGGCTADVRQPIEAVLSNTAMKLPLKIEESLFIFPAAHIPPSSPFSPNERYFLWSQFYQMQ